MKFVTGIDSVEIRRIEDLMGKERFFTEVLGENEYIEYRERGLKSESIAGAFCAKEAFGKALGTGVSGFSWNEVEILHNEKGKPYYSLSGKAKKIAEREGLAFELSITHTRTTATAIAIAYKEEG